MALIQCPECGNQISDKAENCIHCGFPLNKTQENLIISVKYEGPINKIVYYLYDENGILFDSVLAGEKKCFKIDKPITLILGHKRGSFVGSAVKDSKPFVIDPNRVTCLEASISPGYFNREYILTPTYI